MERAGKIIERVFRFLPAHLKLQNSVITQQDCLGYLKNDDTEKLLLLDVPYIGSEPTCAVTSYKYQPFHQKVAEYLFLYYRQSIPPKSNNIFNRADAKHIMKMRLARHFMNKEYYFQKVSFKEDTELIINNQKYDRNIQFSWVSFEQDVT